MTPKDLSECWNISVAQTALTFKTTTYNLLISIVIPISRRYRGDRMFGVRRLRCVIVTDIIDAICSSIHGDRYCLILHPKNF